MLDGEVIKEFNEEEVEKFLTHLYSLTDKHSPMKYLLVNDAAHKCITEYLFKDNKYKVRLEEIAGIKYTYSPMWKDQATPQVLLSPLDIGKIVMVYTDYEGNQTNIEDLFNSNIISWIKTQ